MVQRTKRKENGRGFEALFTPLERFWMYARKLPGEDACWAWIGHRSPVKVGGHALLQISTRKSVKAHSFAYQEWIGPVPKGRELHHTCLHSWCVKPSHLLPVTHREHMRLHKLTWGGKEYCPRGHPLKGRNLIVHSHQNGRQYSWCRECERVKQWLLRHGMKISDFKTAEEIAAIVPPRRLNRSFSHLAR